MTTLSSKDWHQVLGRGVLSALLFCGFSMGHPLWIIGAIFHQVPLFSVGLQYGIRSLSISALLSFTCILALNGIMHALVYGLFFIGPCFLVTFQALRYRKNAKNDVQWYPSGRIVAHLTAYILGLTVLLSSALLSGDNLQVLQQALSQGLGQFNKNVEALYRPFIAQLVLILPAFFASFLFVLTLINAILAQNILEKSKYNIRSAPSMSELELPWWPWWVLAVIGVLAFFGKGAIGLISLNVFGVLLNAFLMEGLAIIHIYATKYEQRNLFLWIFYTLMVVFGWLALPVLIVGIFEPWLNLKERFGKI